MIEYNSKVWFRHIFDFHKTDTFRILLVEMMLVGVYAAVVATLEIFVLPLLLPGSSADANSAFYKSMKESTVVHSILGFVLSLLLVFRTNTAYDRWWEGRKLWGVLVNNCRNLAIKIDTLLPESDDATRNYFRVMIPNFPFALKEHLRKGVDLDELDDVENFKSTTTGVEHIPSLLIRSMYQKTKQMFSAGKISGDELIVLDKNLNSFADIMGACERILKSPIPYTYNIFLKKFIFFYIATLPIGFVAYFGYWAVPICVFVFYVLVSLEIIAEEIEDPFGTDANDLPTQILSENIRKNVNEIFAMGGKDTIGSPD